MYEQREVPVFRRILWIMLWVVLSIAIIAVLVWAVFFRTDGDMKKTKPTTTRQQSGASSNGSSAKPTTGVIDTSDNNQSNTTATNTAPATTSQPTAVAQPTELVNTGAGNVVPIAATAVLTGSALYHIRLRKKLVH